MPTADEAKHDALIAELLLAVPEEIVADLGPNDILARGRCIMATVVGLNALRYFGYDPKPEAVAVQVFNEAYVQWAKEGQPGGEDACIARGGRLVATDYLNESRQGGYNGHLVVRLDDTLIDLDLRQFVRPEKKILLPDSGLLPVNESFDAGKPMIYEKNGCLVTYTKIDNLSYKRAPDWRKRNEGTRSRMAGRVIRRMRASMTDLSPV